MLRLAPADRVGSLEQPIELISFPPLGCRSEQLSIRVVRDGAAFSAWQSYQTRTDALDRRIRGHFCLRATHRAGEAARAQRRADGEAAILEVRGLPEWQNLSPWRGGDAF